MARLLRALFVCSLLVTFSMFAQSADQEMLSAVDSPDPVIAGQQHHLHDPGPEQWS